MARRTQTVIISTDGRDKGKKFILTEMSADKAERWALRALFLLGSTGALLPDGAMDSGMAGIAAAGLQALFKIPFDLIEPLLTEMWECVQYQHRADQPLQSLFTGDACQIEEVGTRLQLRTALLELHTGFYLAALHPSTESSTQQNAA
jgi:hypothetical protein